MSDKNILEIAQRFLSGLTEKDLELVRQDLLFIDEHKARLLLAIETYDIINYYAPYFDKKFLQYDKAAIKQQIIVNEKVFNDQPIGKDIVLNKVVLLKQYLTELFYFKSGFDSKIQKYRTPRFIEALHEEVITIKKKCTTPDDLAPEDFEKLTIYLILSDEEGILRDFNRFTAEKIINVFDLDEVINRSDHEHMLLLDPDDDRIEQMFDSFVAVTEHFRKERLTPREAFHFLENSHSDIEAISTIIDYNHQLSKSTKSNILMLYVSSAEKTKTFSDIAEKGGYFPTIKGRENYNIIRTIPQIFFTKILLEEKERNEHFDPIATLNFMLGIKENINIETHGTKSTQFLQVLTNVISNYYSMLDTHFYFDTYCSYKNLLSNRETSASDDVKQIVDMLDGYLKNKSIANFDMETYVKNYDTKLLLSSLLSSKERISVRFGKDIIRNSFHHLPYLLFVTNNAGAEITNEPLFDFLISITDICNFAQPIQHVTAAVTDYIKKHVNVGFERELYLKNYVRRSLIDKYLYSFFSKGGPIISYFDTLDLDELIRSLKKERAILNSVQYPNASASESVKASLTREMDYVLLWLYRRNKRNNEAINLGEKLVETYKDDARLYHGLALAYVELIYGELDKKNIDYAEVLEKIDMVIDRLLSKGAYCYELLQQKNKEVWKNDHVNELIVKSKCAVHNTLADLFIRKYETKKLMHTAPSFKILKRARAHIKEAKNCLEGIGARYEKYPINNITEAELEYFEALHYYDEGDYVNASDRIEFAFQRCQHGKDISVEKRFFDKIDDIEKLREKINRKRSNSA